MFVFFSNRVGCLGSIAISLLLSAVLFLAFRGCGAGTYSVDAAQSSAVPIVEQR